MGKSTIVKETGGIDGSSVLEKSFGPIVIAAALALALPACALITSAKTGQPLNQAQVQQDMQNALFILKTAGCVLDTAAIAAAPIVAISADAQGQQVLAASDATGKVLCTATVPPTALPAPAPANAPAAMAAVPAA